MPVTQHTKLCPQCGREFATPYKKQVCCSRECGHVAQVIARRIALGERFMLRTKRLENGCLISDLSATWGGYPTMRVDNKLRLASYVAWFLHYGEWPPEGKILDHICHPNTCTLGVECPHRRCVEWSHLVLSTYKENLNSERRASPERRRTHCPQGHEYTPENTYVDKNGGRNCRQCNLRRGREFHARRRTGEAA